LIKYIFIFSSTERVTSNYSSDRSCPGWILQTRLATLQIQLTACDIFAFTVTQLQDNLAHDYCRSLRDSASDSLTLFSVNLSEKALQRKPEGQEGDTPVDFLQHFNYCYATRLALFKGQLLVCSHNGRQGTESQNHLGWKRPFPSSDKVFCMLTDESGFCRNLRYTRDLRPISHEHLKDDETHVKTLQIPGTLDVSEKPSFHLWYHQGNVFRQQESISTTFLARIP